jgi:hypothetical protein
LFNATQKWVVFFSWKNNKNICTSFVAPFVPYFNSSILDYFSDEQIIFDEPKMITDTLSSSFADVDSSCEDFILAGELLREHKSFYFEKQDTLRDIESKNLIAFNRVSVQNKIFIPLRNSATALCTIRSFVMTICMMMVWHVISGRFWG